MNFDAINKKIANLPPVVIRLMPVLIWLGLVVVHLPLLVVYTRDMLSHDYYESLPLLWLVFALFLVIRTETIQLRSFWQSLIVAGLLLLDAGLLFAGSWMYSPWLAYTGLFFGSLALLLMCKDKSTGKSLMPLAILLLVTIRLPLNYDIQLISDLQLKTSATSSRILNELGCLHYRAGNTLEVKGASLFIAEACSGVQSLFTLVACSAFLVVYLRRHWLHATFLFASAWLWAGLMNTVRVSTISLAQGWYQYDLISGWQHDLLGYACLFLAFLFLLSTDQALYFIFGPVVLNMDTDEVLLSETDEELPNSPLTNFWNSAFSWESRLGISPKQIEPEVKPDRLQIQRMMKAPLFAIALVVLVGVAQAWTTQKNVQSKKTASEFSEDVIYPVEMLPEMIGEWQLVSFKTEGREDPEIWSRRSSVWTYQRNKSVVVVSLNYPYSGWKRLQLCYEGTGWHITDEKVVLDEIEQPWMEFAIANKLGQNQYILYTMFNIIGDPLDPPQGIWDRVKLHRRLRRSFSDGSSYLLQVQSASHTVLTPQAIDEMREVASQAAEIIRGKFKQTNMKESE